MRLRTMEYDIELLSRKSFTVDISDRETKNDIKDMIVYCQENKIHSISAIQLGIQKRIIYFDNSIIINPIIIKKEGLTYYWETCPSCLNYIGLVPRPYKVEIEHFDIAGNIIHHTFEGMSATLIMHEYDHLNGYLHIDNALAVFNMPAEEQKTFRESHKYLVIKKDGNFDENQLQEKRLITKKLTK